MFVVTGGSSGFGLSIAKALAAAGARLVIAGRSQQRLESAAKAIGGSVESTTVDICSDDEVTTMIDNAATKFGKIDGLVNCAGVSTRKAIADSTPDDFQEMWEVNFLGMVRCTRAVLPELIANKGHVVNIGSLASKVGTPFLGAYPASKFPVAAYSQQLRLELAETGLHVLLVCPGPLKRDDAGNRYDAESDDLPSAARLPGGGSTLSLIDPDWLANQIVWACERRRKELVVPAKARILFAISQLFPALGDWILQRSLKS